MNEQVCIIRPTSTIWLQAREAFAKQRNGLIGSWTDMPPLVLLVGGSSSVGKTTVAGELALRLGWEVSHADRMLPTNKAFNPLGTSLEVWDRPAEEICALLVGAAVAAIPPLCAEVEARRGGSTGTVMEGERLHPRLVASFAAASEVRGAFVVESDGRRLYETLMARSRSFRVIDEHRRRAVAEVDRLYGLWLLRECAKLGIPCVPSQPWDTLSGRLLGAIRDDAGGATASCRLLTS